MFEWLIKIYRPGLSPSHYHLKSVRTPWRKKCGKPILWSRLRRTTQGCPPNSKVEWIRRSTLIKSWLITKMMWMLWLTTLKSWLITKMMWMLWLISTYFNASTIRSINVLPKCNHVWFRQTPVSILFYYSLKSHPCALDDDLHRIYDYEGNWSWCTYPCKVL